MSKIKITVDSGADIPPERARELGIEVIPFHMSLGDVAFDDGEISPDDMLGICAEEGVMPKTSACSPADYAKVFERLLDEDAETEILHLALSSDLTRSFLSALDASETEPRITCLDTQTVTGAYGLIAEKIALFVRKDPDATMPDVLAYAHDLIDRIRLGFIPNDLAFLKAGGRLGNAGFVAAQVLNIRPAIEIEEGKLAVKKKLRGSLKKIVGQFLDEFFTSQALDLDQVVLLFSTGLPEKVREVATKKAEEAGFRDIRWLQAGCVISSHCGPEAFGCVVLTDPEGESGKSGKSESDDPSKPDA